MISVTDVGELIGIDSRVVVAWGVRTSLAAVEHPSSNRISSSR
ncbi:MAG: hypothetical protein WA751_10290 [Candidatus Dormiibacterota bacterium]